MINRCRLREASRQSDVRFTIVHITWQVELPTRCDAGSVRVLPTSFLFGYRRSIVDLSAPSSVSAEAMACRSNDTSSLVANLVSWLSLSLARSKKRPFVHSAASGREAD